jgi:phosphoribosylamine---glycine ligase
MKNILLLGAGGRESALAWKLAQSPLCNMLFIAPGNAGTVAYGTNLPVSYNDFEAVKNICITHNIDIVLPGPEEPLVNGIKDFFQNDDLLRHIYVAGPGKTAAQLEGSKAFSKAFMQRHNIPTAQYKEFSREHFQEASAFLDTIPPPYVIKADGLAAGKGVIITDNVSDARTALRTMMLENQFGNAGNTVVIEQFLIGIELSVFVLTDGENYILLPEAKDYKRIGLGDTGLNTGGMGAISPVPFADASFMAKVRDQIIEPTIAGLKKDNIPYEGFIFFGLMNVDGQPYVIEYNCRLGDPETEVVIPRMESDLVEILIAMSEKKLSKVQVVFTNGCAAAVMAVAGGYPGNYRKGDEVLGLDHVTNAIIFHAGTSERNGKIVSNGGRVLAVAATAPTLTAALEKVYKDLKVIQWEGMYYRTDIGNEFI